MQLRKSLAFGFGLVLAFGFAGTGSAQAPKKAPPKPKFTAQQIAEAEWKLTSFKSALHHEEPKDVDDDPLLRPFLPPRPRGPVDLVAFPEVTTDADLAKLLPFANRLPALKGFDLGPCHKISAGGLKHLARVPDLEGLFLDGLELPDDALKELAALPNLMWLDLSNTPTTAAAVRELANLKRLQTLILKHVPKFSADGI